MEYRIYEMELRNHQSLLTRFLVALFGVFCAEFHSQPVSDELNTICTGMALQNFRLASQLVITGRRGRSEVIILFFEREGGLG